MVLEYSKKMDKKTMEARAAKRKERTNRTEAFNFRATEEMKTKAQAVKSLMQVGSTSEVFRRLLDDKAKELGLNNV